MTSGTYLFLALKGTTLVKKNMLRIVNFENSDCYLNTLFYKRCNANTIKTVSNV
jgi:hypothetical protein